MMTNEKILKTIKLFEDKLEKEMDDINQDLPDSKQLTKNAVIKNSTEILLIFHTKIIIFQRQHDMVLEI